MAGTTTFASWARAGKPHEPSDKMPWNLQRVGHRYRRTFLSGQPPSCKRPSRTVRNKTIPSAAPKGGAGLAEFDKATAVLARLDRPRQQRRAIAGMVAAPNA